MNGVTNTVVIVGFWLGSFFPLQIHGQFIKSVSLPKKEDDNLVSYGLPKRYPSILSTFSETVQIESNRNSFSVHITKKASERETLVIFSTSPDPLFVFVLWKYFYNTRHGYHPRTTHGEIKFSTWILQRLRMKCCQRSNNSVGSTQK